MKTIREKTRELVSENRRDILKVSFLYSVLATVSHLIAQRFNLSWLGIAFSGLLIIIYLLHLYDYIHESVINKDKMDWRTFFKIPKVGSTRKLISIFFSYVAWIILSFILMILLIPNTSFGILAILFTLTAFVYVNGINYTLAQSEKNKVQVKHYLAVLKTIGQNYRVLLYGILQVVKTVIQGAILIFMLNVFVYGPEIQKLLQLPEAEGNPLIAKVFRNTGSSFIQGVGSQMIMFYLFFVILLLYGVFRAKEGERIE